MICRELKALVGTESTRWFHLVSLILRVSNVDFAVTSFGISGKHRRSPLTRQPINDCEPKQPNQVCGQSTHSIFLMHVICTFHTDSEVCISISLMCVYLLHLLFFCLDHLSKCFLPFHCDCFTFIYSDSIPTLCEFENWPCVNIEPLCWHAFSGGFNFQKLLSNMQKHTSCCHWAHWNPRPGLFPGKSLKWQNVVMLMRHF